MNTYEQMHSGGIYRCTDPELTALQAERMQLLWRFNQTPPSDPEERGRLLGRMFAEIGKDCWIEPPLYANWGGKHVHFGNGVYANFGLTLVDDTHVYVGDNVLFGPHVTLCTGTHPVSPRLRALGMQYNKPVRIGSGCWLGAGVIVMPGVMIGENTVVGAGSVVTRDLPANVVAVGTPCRVLRQITARDDLFYDGGKPIDPGLFFEE